MYKTIIKKHNACINDNSIIPIYDIEERGIAKFVKLNQSVQYMQHIEPTNESKQKGKYFVITTKTDYSKILKKVTHTVKYGFRRCYYSFVLIYFLTSGVLLNRSCIMLLLLWYFKLFVSEFVL